MNEHLIVITCTYERPGRLALLSALADQLQRHPNLTWIVVDDASEPSGELVGMLPSFAIHLAVGPTNDHFHKQRNFALEYVRKNLFGIVYNINDDNEVSDEIFAELRTIKRFGFLPVAGLGPAGIERPIVSDGRYMGWEANWKDRLFPVDLAGFAFHSSLLGELESPLWQHQGCGGESEFLSKLGIDIRTAQFLCDDCTKVMVWHHCNRLMPKSKATPPNHPMRPVHGLENKTKQDFEVVVSRFHEDVAWVGPMWGRHATVYDKSGDTILGRVPLSNVGREAGTYLHHIVTRWDSLADRTLFLQGDPFDHATLPWEDYVLRPEPFLTCYNDRRKMDVPYCFNGGHVLVPDKYAWCRDVIARAPTPEHEHNWGAQFAADKWLILRCGKDYWQRLYEFAHCEGLVLATRKKYSPYEIAVMFEYSWPQIFLGNSG